ncbi:hypothetical protein F5146DRAFT_1135739 [Armillaria mellea]|nr:hypothetical protein F5146DRAFT_1135739 [Armillaria mellea]
MPDIMLVGLVDRLELARMFMEDLHRLRLSGIIPVTFIKAIGHHQADALTASSTPKWYRDTPDIDFIVSDARGIEKILVETYPEKYSLDLKEKSLNMSVKYWGDAAFEYVRFHLMSVNYLPRNHPATSKMFCIDQMARFPYNFDEQAAATLLDLIVLKIGAMVTKNRHNPKKGWTHGQDCEDLQNLARYQNKVMKTRGPLDATASSGEDLHAIYLYAYYNHPRAAASTVILRSWLSLGPGNSPSLLDAQGNTILRDGDRAGLRARWESEEGDDR